MILFFLEFFKIYFLKKTINISMFVAKMASLDETVVSRAPTAYKMSHLRIYWRRENELTDVGARASHLSKYQWKMFPRLLVNAPFAHPLDLLCPAGMRRREITADETRKCPPAELEPSLNQAPLSGSTKGPILKFRDMKQHFSIQLRTFEKRPGGGVNNQPCSNMLWVSFVVHWPI